VNSWSGVLTLMYEYCFNELSFLYHDIDKMKSSTFVCLLLALSSIAFVSAQNPPCNGVSTGDYASCYALRADCHYDPGTKACLDNAPSSCSKYYTDVTGCTGNSACTYSYTLNMCTDQGAACSTILTQSPCELRSDCQWSGSVCEPNVSTTTCAARTTSGECQVHGCIWDPFLGKCFATSAEITSQYACSVFSGYPAPNYACAWHSCELAGSTCVNVGSGYGQSDNQSVVVMSFSDFYVNPSITKNTLDFYIDVVTDFKLDRVSPIFTYIALGAMSFGQTANFQPNTICNDMKTRELQPPQPLIYPQVPADYDSHILRDAFVTQVNTYHNFDFPNTDVGNYLRQIFGDIRVGPSYLIQSVAVSPTNDTITASLHVDLAAAVQNCTFFDTKPTKTIGPDSTQYALPISVVRHDHMDAWYETTAFFYVTILSTGSITFSSTSQYQPKVFIGTGADFPTSGCAVGEKRQRIVYTMQYSNVFDSSLLVCPRSCTDVTFVDPQTTDISNAYGDSCVSVSYPTRSPQGVSTCQVTIQSRCRSVQADGKAFFFANRAKDADRIADMGSDIPYPSLYDGVHTFYVNPYQWKTDLSAFELAVQSPMGYPDPVVVTYNQHVFPDSGTSIELTVFDIEAGLLPTPTSNLSEFISLVSIINGTVHSTTPDLFNYQLRWDKAITPVIRAKDPSILASVDLRILNEILNFSIEALDAKGHKIAEYVAPLGWTDIARHVSYIDKNGVGPHCEILTCSKLPGLADHPGADGFSIMVSTLRALQAGNGYRFSFRYRFDTESYSAPGRRLLSLDGPDRHLLSTSNNADVASGIASFLLLIEDTMSFGNDTLAPVVPVESVLLRLSAESNTETAVGASVGVAVGATIATIVVGMAASSAVLGSVGTVAVAGSVGASVSSSTPLLATATMGDANVGGETYWWQAKNRKFRGHD